jgi:hypothetical protein
MVRMKKLSPNALVSLAYSVTELWLESHWARAMRSRQANFETRGLSLSARISGLWVNGARTEHCRCAVFRVQS